MVVTMKRQKFNSFDPALLAWACMEPTLQQIHGINPTVKSRQLSLRDGQNHNIITLVLSTVKWPVEGARQVDND
jgi:hypothetical protein